MRVSSFVILQWYTRVGIVVAENHGTQDESSDYFAPRGELSRNCGCLARIECFHIAHSSSVSRISCNAIRVVSSLIMSGAEAFIAIGIASNFIQLIEFTATLCSRIREYSSGSGTPKRLVAQADRLADLLTVLRSLEKSSGQSPLDESVLSRCQAQAQELADLLESLKGGSQSRLQNARKALKSLSRSDQLEELQTILDSLVNTLSLQLQADTR